MIPSENDRNALDAARVARAQTPPRPPYPEITAETRDAVQGVIKTLRVCDDTLRAICLQMQSNPRKATRWMVRDLHTAIERLEALDLPEDV